MNEKQTFPVGVSVLLTDRWGKILMAKRKNNSGAGLISTPGGRLEFSETLLDCAKREFTEETGAELVNPRIVGWAEHFRFGNHYIMFYAHASAYTGEIRNLIPDKSEDWSWFYHETLTKENCTEPPEILARVINGNPLEIYGTHKRSCAFAINGITDCSCGYWEATRK